MTAQLLLAAMMLGGATLTIVNGWRAFVSTQRRLEHFADRVVHSDRYGKERDSGAAAPKVSRLYREFEKHRGIEVPSSTGTPGRSSTPSAPASTSTGASTPATSTASGPTASASNGTASNSSTSSSAAGGSTTGDGADATDSPSEGGPTAHQLAQRLVDSAKDNQVKLLLAALGLVLTTGASIGSLFV